MSDRLGNIIRLKHIIDALTEIETYIYEIDELKFIENSLIKNACIRQLEIIGEAANKLDTEIYLLDNSIPWVKLIGLRNLLIHEYFGVDDLIIWNIVSKETVFLKEKIEIILTKIDNK